jgi:catecholate siderophore receptor
VRSPSGAAPAAASSTRTLKEADGQRVYEATAQTGSYYDRRFTLAPNGDLTAFFGSPNLNYARADVHTVMGFIDHDFGNGLTVKNGTYFADFKKFYQNVYPGNGPLAGAVNPSNFTFNRAAYNHTTNRDNTFNDTDFIYKVYTGPLFHTIGFGTQFGRADRH